MRIPVGLILYLNENRLLIRNLTLLLISIKSSLEGTAICKGVKVQLEVITVTLMLPSYVHTDF